jgi:hypothetical protein
MLYMRYITPVALVLVCGVEGRHGPAGFVYGTRVCMPVIINRSDDLIMQRSYLLDTRTA